MPCAVTDYKPGTSSPLEIDQNEVALDNGPNSIAYPESFTLYEPTSATKRVSDGIRTRDLQGHKPTR